MPVAGENILVRKIDFKNCVNALTINASGNLAQSDLVLLVSVLFREVRAHAFDEALGDSGRQVCFRGFQRGRLKARILNGSNRRSP